MVTVAKLEKRADGVYCIEEGHEYRFGDLMPVSDPNDGLMLDPIAELREMIEELALAVLQSDGAVTNV